MGLLLPALSRAREIAKRIVCANHLKTLMSANYIYSQSYDGAFVPVVYYRFIPNVVMTPWVVNLAYRRMIAIDEKGKASGNQTGDLFASPAAYLCPDDHISISKDPTTIADQGGVLWSYGLNATEFLKKYGWFDPISNWTTPPVAGHKVQSITRPAEKLAFIDSVDWWVGWEGANYETCWDVLHEATIGKYQDAGCYGPTIYRHNPEGVNVAFYDGHVSYLRKKEVYIKEDYCKHPGMWVVNCGIYVIKGNRPECGCP